MRGSRPGERRGGRKRERQTEKTAYARAVIATHSANPNVTPTGVVEGGNGTGLMPLSFLLEVLHNAEAPAAMKIKVASATLPYTQPRQSKRPATPTVVGDRHGFAVDPVVARKLRNAIARLDVLKRRRKPTVKERAAARRLGEKIRALVAILPCPSVEEYTTRDASGQRKDALFVAQTTFARETHGERGRRSRSCQRALLGVPSRSRKPRAGETAVAERKSARASVSVRAGARSLGDG